MRIGIITILKVNNYGAELQAYATQAILNNLGYDAEIIDYLFYKNPRHRVTKLSKPIFSLGWKKEIAEWLYPKLEYLRTIKHSKCKKSRIERFDQFHKEHTRLSCTYRTMDDLYNNVPDYDIYIVGSDQVWNPNIYSSLEPYLLTFAPEDKKRIAYASSFGVSEIKKGYIQFYKDRLKYLNAIGVREKQAVKLVNEVLGLKAKLVLDPTLLLDADEWFKVAKKLDVPKNDYILIYELTPCHYIKELALYINSVFKKKRIIRICKQAIKQDTEANIVNIMDAGPSEFIYLFANASMVITNSFHGTAFSINFQRPFYTVLPLRKQNNSRQQSLLELFKLTERLLIEGDKFPSRNNFAIDYRQPDEMLKQERIKSINFLKNAIEK